MNNHEPITDVRTLGTGKTIILGLQHTFAMFGATVLVPILTHAEACSAQDLYICSWPLL